MEAVECGAVRERSQTQEIGLAGENSVVVMVLDELCSLRDKLRNGLTLSGWKKWEDGWKKFQCDTKDVRRY
jgi:hypothetical protein